MAIRTAAQAAAQLPRLKNPPGQLGGFFLGRHSLALDGAEGEVNSFSSVSSVIPTKEMAKLRVNPLFFAPSIEDTAISKNDFGKFLTGY